MAMYVVCNVCIGIYAFLLVVSMSLIFAKHIAIILIQNLSYARHDTRQGKICLFHDVHVTHVSKMVKSLNMTTVGIYDCHQIHNILQCM